MAQGGRRKVLRTMTNLGNAFTEPGILGLVFLVAGCGGSAPPGVTGPSADGGSATTVDASADTTSGASGDATLPPADARVAQCGKSNCLGCCVQDVCFPGNDEMACGSGGLACQTCATGGQACVGQQCVTPCGAGTCAGCCANNQCVSGTVATACGRQGGQCADCTLAGSSCVSEEAGAGGACAGPAENCSPQTCIAGCCDSQGVCASGTVTSACGTAGASCQSCPAGMFCRGQKCVRVNCTPQQCRGCCDDKGLCHSGIADTQCGRGAALCEDCSLSGLYCDSTKRCGSPAQDGGICNCAAGCCDEQNQCHPGSSNTQCGSYGELCSDCTASGTQCTNQYCGDPALNAAFCNEQTCPSGCCDEYGVCQQGITSTACGTLGTNCTNCLSAGFLCSNQRCVSQEGGLTCGPFNCLGCCDAFDTCHVFPTGNQCGSYGVSCFECPPDAGSTCSQSCSGCCDVQGNCQLGLADTLCGQYGSSCQDCTALNPPSTCDLSVNVVACASQQSQCPAPYPACPAALTQAAPTPQKGACSMDDLQSAASACSGGANTSACQNFFQYLNDMNLPCDQCLSPFDYDFTQEIGIASCAEPYVDAACNHSNACLVDCLTQTCFGCADSPAAAMCTTQARSATCSTYVQASQCSAQAFNAAAAVCNPGAYQNFGAWLEAVGSRYCGP